MPPVDIRPFAGQSGLPPSPTGQPSAPAEAPDLRSRWSTFLAQPENRTALLQFGVSMLGASPQNTLAQNLGGAIGEAAESRDRAIIGEAGAAKAGLAAGLAQRKTEADIALAEARTARARRPAEATRVTGALTAKDYQKSWTEYVANNAGTKTIPELKADHDAIWSAGASGPTAPAATTGSVGSRAAAISAMTLDQLQQLDPNTATPEEASAWITRYKALGGK